MREIHRVSTVRGLDVTIGRCLMTAMLVELRLRAVTQVSLSVKNDNPARMLYESLRFVPRETADGATTMAQALPRPPESLPARHP